MLATPTPGPVRVDAMLAETRARQQAVPMTRASGLRPNPGGIGDPVNIGIQSGGRSRRPGNKLATVVAVIVPVEAWESDGASSAGAATGYR